jgi:ketosteroid isomerase-like protein
MIGEAEVQMRKASTATWAVAIALLAALARAQAPTAEPAAALAEAVRARETAFARTMADRDHAAFASFVAEEALFFGSDRVLRGRAAVAEGWKRYFEDAPAPFSWAPERVEVVDSGTLALSSGPVLDPAGRRVGTFISTWRLEKDGVWRVVLDIGCPPCRGPGENP